MTRALLILADILVTLLLYFSIILLYLYPPEVVMVEEINVPTKVSIHIPTEQNFTFENLMDEDEFMTFEDFTLITEEEIINSITVKNYLNSTLNDRLEKLSAKVGDAVFIRIFKEESILEVWIDTGTEYEHLIDYKICAYSGHLGPKQKEGDKQSPEGFYKVKKYQLNPNSKFHLSFNLGYPNKYDRSHKRTGSFLMVHGNCVSIGCYAMTNTKIEEIYSLVESALKRGQKYVQVHTYPFYMTKVNMARHSQNRWYGFWVNLKEGYDYFEAEKRPPLIGVKDKSYVIYE